MSDNYPSHPLGALSVRVGRAYFAKDKAGNAHSVLLLASANGSGKNDDGAEISFSVAGCTIHVQLRYHDDTSEDSMQQRYEIDIGDICEAVNELNKRRRAEKFADAPPTEHKEHKP